MPSIRLKAYLRGQQDVEYLTILSSVLGKPHWAVAAAARPALGLKAELHKTRDADVDVLMFSSLNPVDLWALRTRVGAMLDETRPPAKRKWLDLRTLIWDMSTVSEPGHIPMAQRGAVLDGYNERPEVP